MNTTAQKKSIFIPVLFVLLLIITGLGTVYVIAFDDADSWLPFGKKAKKAVVAITPPTAQPQPVALPPVVKAPTPPTTNNTVKALATTNATKHQPTVNATLPLTNATSFVVNATAIPLATNSTMPNMVHNATIIESSKGKPLDKPGNAVGGLALSPNAASKNSRIPSQRSNDATIRHTFIAELAKVCVANYWPRGTHPAAQYHGVSTLSIKWLNTHFGNNTTLLGSHGNNTEAKRHLVLDYVLMPSMVNELYKVYGSTFVALLETEAQKQTKNTGDAKRHLTAAETAEMFAIYSSQTKALAGALRAFTLSPEIPELLVELAVAEKSASEEHYRLIEASDSLNGEIIPDENISLSYQQAIKKREQINAAIATTLRNKADTRGLENTTLVYIASWLSRRPTRALPAIEAAANCLQDLAVKLEAAELQYQEQTPTQ